MQFLIMNQRLVEILKNDFNNKNKPYYQSMIVINKVSTILIIDN